MTQPPTRPRILHRIASFIALVTLASIACLSLEVIYYAGRLAVGWPW